PSGSYTRTRHRSGGKSEKTTSSLRTRPVAVAPIVMSSEPTGSPLVVFVPEDAPDASLAADPEPLVSLDPDTAPDAFTLALAGALAALVPAAVALAGTMTLGSRGPMPSALASAVI